MRDGALPREEAVPCPRFLEGSPVPLFSPTTSKVPPNLGFGGAFPNSDFVSATGNRKPHSAFSSVSVEPGNIAKSRSCFPVNVLHISTQKPNVVAAATKIKGPGGKLGKLETLVPRVSGGQSPKTDAFSVFGETFWKDLCSERPHSPSALRR